MRVVKNIIKEKVCCNTLLHIEEKLLLKILQNTTKKNRTRIPNKWHSNRSVEQSSILEAQRVEKSRKKLNKNDKSCTSHAL